MNIRCQSNDSQFKQWAGYMSILQSGERVANFPSCVRYDSEYENVVTYPLYEIDHDKDDDELKALRRFFETERFWESDDVFWLDDPSEEDAELTRRLEECEAEELTERELIDGLDFMRVLDFAFYNLETVDEHNNVIKREKCVAYTKWE